ncbi:MAG: HRDC domain-containing protein [Bifidobacteriaceae bacterium]|jgi:ribonuclease D|nr:HRDC domain-containing protein [Bifidobacteriaceae bacterium]
MTATITPLSAPSGGVPPLVDTPNALDEAAARLAAGQGPVAADAERASGFTYTSRAQLVQLFRRGSGLTLIDAAALPDLRTVMDALSGVEWVFHAASQDLPCLRECGVFPERVFDTELASRLLGEASVGLAAVVARTLGLGLAKEHSAQDWSRRPLPGAWLNYAALDVVVLLDVRDALEKELVAAGKLEMLYSETASVLAAPAPGPRADPWRRTRGAHVLKDSRRLAVLRAMWEARDSLAAERDLFPGRVLPDSALVAAALALPEERAALGHIPPFNGRRQSKLLTYWWEALCRGAATPDIPPVKAPRALATPPARNWARRNPAAADRLAQAKAALAEVSAERRIPVENLAQPELVRQILFRAPEDAAAALAALGARPWQIELVAPVLDAAIAAHPDVP